MFSIGLSLFDVNGWRKTGSGHGHSDINIRAAFVHVIGDLLQNRVLENLYYENRFHKDHSPAWELRKIKKLVSVIWSFYSRLHHLFQAGVSDC